MWAITTAVTALLLGSSMAMPGSVESRSIRLDNGNQTVEVVYSNAVRRSPADDLLARQSNINCKGSAFCELLGSSCDDAFRKIEPGNTYSTFDGAQNSGTCSGTCGIFIGSDHCEATGQELQNAYNDIRTKGSCTHCGKFTRDSDKCVLKIDRVTGC